MRLNRKLLWLPLIPTLVVLGSGCSGINASHSISPATFFLPGLLKADPPPQPAPALPADEAALELAQS